MKTNKEKLVSYIDLLDEDKCELVRKMLRTFSNSYFTKEDLMKLVGEDTNGVDNALPHDYVQRIQEIHPNFKSMFHSYDYRTNTYGEMLNVAENFILKLSEKLSR